MLNKLSKSLLLGLLLSAPLLTSTAPGLSVQGEVGGILIPSGTLGRLSLNYLWGDQHFNYGVESGIMSHSGNDDWLFHGNPGTVFDVLGVTKYNFDSGFNVFAKAGGAYLDFNGDKYRSASSGVAPEFAVGTGYQFTPSWGSSLTVSAIPRTNSTNQGLLSLALGVSYHFN